MKKTLLALAVLGSVAGVAQAQSAVTVYGKVDLGLQKQTGTTTQLAPNHASRIGFKGTEDLGGGLSAIFQIENRFDASTGTQTGLPNQLFEGQSIVGLTGGFGTVKLGRTYNVVDLVGSAAIDPFEGDGVPGMLALTAARLSNTVTYVSPNMSGFSASVQGQLSEVSGLKKGWGVAGAYENGPITAGLGYQKLVQTVPSPNQANVWGVSGSYAFGPAKVLLGYDRLDTNDGAPKTKNAVVGATYTIGAGLIKAAYNHAKQGDDKFRKLAVGYQHNMSKRTSVYADIARSKETTPGFADETVNGVQVGVTHNF